MANAASPRCFRSSTAVQGRTAAGGWSQQRFARRRDNQAKAALGDAAE
ncbi:Vms1/Ankzf1 family peptidyl-tRNA hydrolase, partial [Micromonospora chalcea]